MSVIDSNTKLYQIYFNRKVSEYIKNNIDGDVSEYISELKEKENLLNIINKDVLCLCDLLRKFNGKLYGGIVRSFLLRQEDTKDIDIWFTNDNNMSGFIGRIENFWEGYIVDNELDSDRSSSEKYPFEKKTYIITSPSTGLKYSLDLVLSKKFPVDDYDVNCVTFDGKKFNIGKGGISRKLVLENISKKEMLKLFTFKNTQSDKLRENKFRENGWQIKNINIDNKLGFFNFSDVYNSLMDNENI